MKDVDYVFRIPEMAPFDPISINTLRLTYTNIIHIIFFFEVGPSEEDNGVIQSVATKSETILVIRLLQNERGTALTIRKGEEKEWAVTQTITILHFCKSHPLPFPSFTIKTNIKYKIKIKNQKM